MVRSRQWVSVLFVAGPSLWKSGQSRERDPDFFSIALDAGCT
jgi:hypothetical protein